MISVVERHSSPRFALARLIAGHICLHACMAGMRMAAPLLALSQGYSPLAVGLLLVNWFLSSCWDMHTFVVPVLGHERGFSASVIGAILGSFAITAALVRLLLPLFAARLREWAVIMGAMLLTAVLFAIYPFMQSPMTMGACSVLLGLVLGSVLGSVQPMIMSTLHQITPKDRHGEALGLRLMSLNGSSVLMPLLFGTVGAVVGVSVVFWSVGLMVGLGARAAWLLRVEPLRARSEITCTFDSPASGALRCCESLVWHSHTARFAPSIASRIRRPNAQLISERALRVDKMPG